MKRKGLEYAAASLGYGLLMISGFILMIAVWFLLPWMLALAADVAIVVFVAAQEPVPPVDPR